MKSEDIHVSKYAMIPFSKVSSIVLSTSKSTKFLNKGRLVNVANVNNVYLNDVIDIGHALCCCKVQHVISRLSGLPCVKPSEAYRFNRQILGHVSKLMHCMLTNFPPRVLYKA